MTRKPTALKILQGTFQPCRHNPDEPIVPVAAPERPKYLKGFAKKEWERLVPILLSARILTVQDQGALALLCLLQAKVIEAAKRGEVLSGQLIAQYRALLTCFGLTPVDRARIKAAPQPKPENQWDKLAQ